MVERPLDQGPVFSPAINYLGSKVRQLPLLDRLMRPHLPPGGTFGDLFAGTGSVAAHFRSAGGTVIANDAEPYSAVLCQALLLCRYTPRLRAMIAELDSLSVSRATGLVAANFSPAGPAGRMFFTPENAARIDAVRARIETLTPSGSGDLSGKERAFLLASLMRSCARVANTSGSYTAYLKTFVPRAKRAFRMLPAHTSVDPVSKTNAVTCGDSLPLALSLASRVKFDVVYLDPPFNGRSYGSYYGFYNYLLAYDPGVEVTGKTGIPADYYRSPWGFAKGAREALGALIGALDARRIFFAYNNAGVLSKTEIAETLRTRGPTVLYVHKPPRAFRPHAGVLGSRDVEDWLFAVDCDREPGPPKGGRKASFREVRSL